GCKQHRRRHHLSRLAVTALRHLLVDPGLLDRVAVISGQSFDRGDLLPGHARQWGHTRTHGVAIDHHGARAAMGDSASKLRPCKTERIAQNPEKWSARSVVRLNAPAVNREFDCHMNSSS